MNCLTCFSQHSAIRTASTSNQALSARCCHGLRFYNFVVASSYSAWLWSWTPHYQRSLSTVAPLHSRLVSEAAPPLDPVSKNVASWSDHRKKAKRLHPDAEKDIIADDLWATLEAHRATNRTSVIRSIRTKDPTKFYPDLKPVVRLSEEQPKEDPAKKWGFGRFWPADSIQNERLSLERQNTTRRGGLLEYQGQCLKPHWPWHDDERPPIYREQPWLSHLKEPGAYGDGLSRLGAEILGYEDYMRLSNAEVAASQQVILDVKQHVESIMPSRELSVVGSHATGLATPLSDIDFSLAMPEFEKHSSERGPSPTRPAAQAVGKSILQSLSRSLMDWKGIESQSVEFVHNARFPVVKAIHLGTGLEIQISAQNLASFVPAREHVIGYLSEYPSLRPLFILIRSALEIRDLSNVYEGGLGSYPLLIMIVTALKHTAGLTARHDLGQQLLSVLNFWAKANFYKSGFSTDPPRVFPKVFVRGKARQSGKKRTQVPDDVKKILRNLNMRKPYSLCLQDPANNVNDLGSKAYAIKHIQRVFDMKGRHLLNQVEWWDGLEMTTRRTWKRGILDGLMKANYDILERRRIHIEASVGAERKPVLQDDAVVLRTLEELIRPKSTISKPQEPSTSTTASPG